MHTNFCGLNVPEDHIECKSSTVICIDSLLVHKKILSATIFRRFCKQTNGRLSWWKSVWILDLVDAVFYNISKSEAYNLL